MSRYLNPPQEQAASTVTGRILVLAGAGSGKTSVLIERISRLVRIHGAKPTEILGLTFTNKAAKEMRERLKASLSSKDANAITLSTFHSFCHKLLRKEIHHIGFGKDFSIYDDGDMKRVIQGCAKQLYDEKNPPPPYEQLSTILSDTIPTGEKESKKLNELKTDVLDALKAYNALNFDQLLMHTIELFKSCPDVLEKYQQRFRFILVDEYQDTNKEQFQLIEMLSKLHGNLFVVGDDDQAIYGWRGAQVENIINFPCDSMIKLEQNYRSTPNVLNAANQVIANNASRHSKKLWTDTVDGERLHVFHGSNEKEEAEGVAKRIIKLREENQLAWKDIAIMFRSNRLSRPFEMAMMGALYKGEMGWQRGIPYQMVQGYEFYERAEVKDFFCYLKVFSNPRDGEALLRIINYPKRGISVGAIDKLTRYSRAHSIKLLDLLFEVNDGKHEELGLSSRARQGIQTFTSLLKNTQAQLQIAPVTAIKNLVRDVGLKDAIGQDVKSEQAQEFKWENVQQCISLLEEYFTNSPQGTLDEFLGDTVLQAEKLSNIGRAKNEDAVQMMTFHSSKGLEFPACFLVGLEEQLIPHEKCQTRDGIEEERRLFYVALTRAKRFLTLSMCRSRTKRGKPQPCTPSRYLFEIEKGELKASSWNFPESYEEYSPVLSSH